jgi:hypothetical protein
VMVLCPDLNPDWFTFNIYFSDKKRATLYIYQEFKNLS